MSFDYSLEKSVNLHVQGRISPEDAKRQAVTAAAILERLRDQPGVILADEVGMGKTYVALATAISVALGDEFGRPVVTMIPPALKEKWPRDFDKFCEYCMPGYLGGTPRFGVATRTVEFFKLLDNPPERRCHVIFLTHGAMSRQLVDPWVKLAMIQRALYRRWNTDDIRKRLGRDLGDLLQLRTGIDRQHPGLLEGLLDAPPERWRRIMQQFGYTLPDDDDPVPVAAIDALQDMDLSSVYDLLQDLPVRVSKHYRTYLAKIRRKLLDEVKPLWSDAIRRLNLRLPLLILDEAHHLKNARTTLASLFVTDEAQDDAQEVSRGPLGGVFERMLFLTATPFQLGHHELCSVLDRFTGIAWNAPTAPSGGRQAFEQSIATLRHSLDETQSAALRLDAAWGTLTDSDLLAGEERYRNTSSWWEAAQISDSLTDAGRTVVQRHRQVQEKMTVAQMFLWPWVIRHLRPRQLSDPYLGVPRRRRLAGEAIAADLSALDKTTEASESPGISVRGRALLPFLLAARVCASNPSTRPVFAEGLASSYEAFLYTRELAGGGNSQQRFATDDDDNAVIAAPADDWHLSQLVKHIPRDSHDVSIAHPKIGATVERVVQLWLAGEKVLVFCHYVATGRVLRSLISQRIREHVVATATRQLGMKGEESEQALGRIGDRFFDVDSPWRNACDAQVRRLLQGYTELGDYHDQLVDIARRFMRTPSFLTRFFDLSAMSDPESAVAQAFMRPDASGLSVGGLLADFLEFLQVRCGQQERRDYVAAIDRIQTGTHLGAAAQASYAEDEFQGTPPELLQPNVRLVNGATRSETRQTLMLAFNTPFYPEVLIASSVLAEGVDLHLNCRQVIHHDLSWNPSSLEQRNGRVDRIGAKAERCGKSIDVYYPYVAETQDDKMYQVGMDRDRWFNVVMGDTYKTDVRTTEKLAARLPFPENAARSLTFDLGVYKR
jgi:hypothetical protein